MKELTTYNRVAGYLNKIFDLLNQTYFEGELPRPTISIQSTPKAYGHFTLREDTWVSAVGATHEINIGAGTLGRPIEEVVSTLLHEMVHYYNYIHGVKDCSRGGTYHNKHFKEEAEKRDLLVGHHQKYGWTITSPSEALMDFCIDCGLTDILLTRNDFCSCNPGGTSIPTGTVIGPSAVEKKSHSIKWICPDCGNIARTTKRMRLLCISCDTEMTEA